MAAQNVEIWISGVSIASLPPQSITILLESFWTNLGSFYGHYRGKKRHKLARISNLQYSDITIGFVTPEGIPIRNIM